MVVWPWGRHGCDLMVVGFSTTCAMSAYDITTEVVRSGRGVQHYVIKIFSDLQQDSGFPWGPLVSSTNKTDHHDIHCN